MKHPAALSDFGQTRNSNLTRARRDDRGGPGPNPIDVPFFSALSRRVMRKLYVLYKYDFQLFGYEEPLEYYALAKTHKADPFWKNM